MLIELQATDYGWEYEEGKYTFKGFEGPQILEKGSDIALENESDDNYDNEYASDEDEYDSDEDEH